MDNKSMNLNQWGLLVILSLVWGGSFFFNEIILRELQPFTAVFSRSFIACVVLIILIYSTRRKMPKTPQIWGAFLVMGLLNNLVPFSLIVWGQQYIDSGLASILNATTPLFSVILGHFLTVDEKLTLYKLVGILLGLVGVSILVGPDALRGIGVHVMAQAAVLLASLSYAFAGIFGRRFQRIEPVISAAGMLTCTAAMALPAAWLIDKPVSFQFQLSTWTSIIGQSVFSTVLAYLIYFRILRSAGATNVLLVTFLIPVSALLLGVFLLNEGITLSMVFGTGLVFLGLIVVDGRLVGAHPKPH
jgi:drug/metabolite transporter (DMT)-like permease